MSFDPVNVLRERFQAAADAAFGPGLPPVTVVASTNPKFGDYQCNSAMAFSKALGKPPRQVATELLSRVDVSGVAEPLSEASIAGPGFINLTLLRAAIEANLAAMDKPDLGIAADPDATTTVVDLCGVNLAKQMHIGHLRSSVIGDTIARVLERLCGQEKVKRQNHVGDWGLPIAMVTDRLMKLERAGSVDLDALTLDELDVIYKQAKSACETCDDDIAFARAWGMGPKVVAELEAANAAPAAELADAKSTLVRLQSGDATVRRVWERLYDLTMAACMGTCSRLNVNVTTAHSAGESFYEKQLGPLVQRLESAGVAAIDDGALVINVENEGIAEPVIIRKRDGGFLYATTDLAAIAYRAAPPPAGLGAQRIIYCVDIRQGLHFRQVFAAARKAGLCPQGTRLEHAGFGTILGDDGRPFKSRSGDSVRLSEVIDEAEQRALVQVRARCADLSADEQLAIARAVAVAAIRYTDLSSERTKDYVFSLERMVQFEGDTGPYLMYAYARTCNLARKAAQRGLKPADRFTVEQPAEKALALLLLRYPDVVHAVGRTLEPHRLCAHLYQTAGAYASFYHDCPVLDAPEPVRAARLALSGLTRRVLGDGLTLLGMPLVERM